MDERHDSDQIQDVNPEMDAAAGAEPAGQGPDPLPAAVVEEIKADVAGEDIGQLGDSDDEREILRYLRRRGRMQAELDRITAEAAGICRTLQNDINRLDGLYIARAREIAAAKLAGKKTKTVKTPFGQMSFRTVPARIFVKEIQQFLDACDSRIEYVDLIRQRPPEPNLTEIKSYVEKTGDLPPGCDQIPQHEKFSVK